MFSCFAEAWLFQGVGDPVLFLTLVKQILHDQFVQNWTARLHDSSRAVFYSNIASSKFQPYLDYFNMNKFCQALTRLRISSHRLQIEAGTWVRPISTPLNDRKCVICNTLEDEYHFVLECIQYSKLRKKYINKKYWQRPNMIKFIELMTTVNKNEIRKLGIFIFNAFSNRNMFMYGGN